MTGDISPNYRYCKKDRQTIDKILPHENTPEAIKEFARLAYRLTDYAYWFILSTLWVGYSGGIDIALWRQLFSSTRPDRDASIMKPSELEIFRKLPEDLIVYRAHRPGETDWIAFTLFADKAAEFALQRDVKKIRSYSVKKADVLALFLRRGEYEIIMLNKLKTLYLGDVAIKV